MSPPTLLCHDPIWYAHDTNTNTFCCATTLSAELPTSSDKVPQHTRVAEELQPSLAVNLLQSFNEVAQRVASLAQVEEEEVPRTSTGPMEQVEGGGEQSATPDGPSGVGTAKCSYSFT